MKKQYQHRGVVRPKTIHPEYGLSRVTAWRLEQSDPEFPKHINVNGNGIGWLRHELDEYFDSMPRVSGGR